MPFTTYNYSERAHREREQEVGMLFPPIHQSSIYIWWKTKHTGRFSLLCLVWILDDMILKSKMEIRGKHVKWAHTRGDEGFGGTWMILKRYFCHVSHLWIINEAWQSEQNISIESVHEANKSILFWRGICHIRINHLLTRVSFQTHMTNFFLGTKQEILGSVSKLLFSNVDCDQEQLWSPFTIEKSSMNILHNFLLYVLQWKVSYTV